MRADRLLHLAWYLENKVNDVGFDFSTYWRSGSCGTVGCAIGYCPQAFPGHWEYRTYSSPVIRNYGFLKPHLITEEETEETLTHTEIFFDIPNEDTHYLFDPYSHHSNFVKGKCPLGPYSTRQEVAKNIRDFVKKNSPTLDHNLATCPMCDGKGKVEVKKEEVCQYQKR